MVPKYNIKRRIQGIQQKQIIFTFKEILKPVLQRSKNIIFLFKKYEVIKELLLGGKCIDSILCYFEVIVSFHRPSWFSFQDKHYSYVPFCATLV